MGEKVLIVEDEADLRIGLEDNLAHEGYEVVTAANGKEGLKKAVESAPDVIVLDVMMPEMNGFEVCRRIRQRGVTAPVIMLTARGKEEDKVHGLELGADDYLTKPFSIRELLARVKAVLRRRGEKKEKIHEYSFGNVKVDFDRLSLTKKGRSADLSHFEAELLRLLVAHRGEPVTRQTILSEVWGYEFVPTTRIIDNHVVKLRQKVEDDPRRPKHVLTVHGLGYKFAD